MSYERCSNFMSPFFKKSPPGYGRKFLFYLGRYGLDIQVWWFGFGLMWRWK